MGMSLGKKTKVKAKGKEIKGKAKKHAGKVTGSKRLRVKGKTDELIGKLKLKSQKAKDVLKK